MSWEKKIIEIELDAIKKEINRYKGKDDNIVMVLEHLEKIYGLVFTLYRKAKMIK